MSFIPSKYNIAIFDEVQHGTSNIVVRAVAGSGKSTTIKECLKLIPSDNSILMLAFNKAIADDARAKIPKDWYHVDVKTLHSYGQSALIFNYKSRLDNNKYRDILSSMIPYWNIPFTVDITEYKSNVLKLCNLARLNLVDTVAAIEEIADNQGIETLHDECKRAINLIDLGIKNTQIIDFTDMIYLPVKLNIKCKQYNYVFTDEAQDLSKCQRMLMLKAVKPGGRTICVGDDKQAIYYFAGADSDSFQELIDLPNTKVLPLSVTYRCPTAVVEIAKKLVPELEARPGAPLGVFSHESKVWDIKDSDMVLCRNTFPLVKLCIRFLSQGRKAHVMGKDIGINLINMLEKTKEPLIDEAVKKLFYDLDNSKRKIMRKKNSTEDTVEDDALYAAQREKVDVIKVFAEGKEKTSEVIAHIKQIFDDNSKEGIKLSTIHRAKGLENERIFLICPGLIPAKYTLNNPKMLAQELNLKYIAYTRAKSEFHLITDDDYSPYRKKKNKETKEKQKNLAEEGVDDFD